MKETLPKSNVISYTIGKFLKLGYLKWYYIFIWNYELKIMTRRNVGCQIFQVSFFPKEKAGEKRT